MVPALGTVDQVAARVGEAITDEDDTLLAEACLDEASALVRFYAQQAWPDPLLAPPVAVAIAIAAAARAYQNPSGLNQERADMVSVKRDDKFAMGCELTPSEILVLKQFGGGAGIYSAQLSSPDQIVPVSQPYPNQRGYCPVDWGSNKPFPLGPDDPYQPWGWI